MRIILYILLPIFIISCHANKELHESDYNSRLDFEDVEPMSDELYEIDPKLDYLLDSESATLEAQPYEKEVLMIRKELTESLRIVEVSNNKISNSTTNEGRIAYKIPTEMLVRNTYQVIVRVSKSSVHIYENLNGEVKTSSIPITQSMEVKVLDPSVSDNKMFDIVSDNKPIQLVENNENVTQWTFNVTPLRSGSSKLKVVVSIIRDGLVKEVVYEDVVTVKTDITKTVPYFIAKYWQWLLSTIIIPIIVWFTKRKKKSEDS